jgi:hypothetical protein
LADAIEGGGDGPLAWHALAPDRGRTISGKAAEWRELLWERVSD